MDTRDTMDIMDGFGNDEEGGEDQDDQDTQEYTRLIQRVEEGTYTQAYTHTQTPPKQSHPYIHNPFRPVHSMNSVNSVHSVHSYPSDSEWVNVKPSDTGINTDADMTSSSAVTPILPHPNYSKHSKPLKHSTRTRAPTRFATSIEELEYIL